MQIEECWFAGDIITETSCALAATLQLHVLGRWPASMAVVAAKLHAVLNGIAQTQVRAAAGIEAAIQTRDQLAAVIASSHTRWPNRRCSTLRPRSSACVRLTGTQPWQRRHLWRMAAPASTSRCQPQHA
nr:hypothetical protein [Micromonospora wenchangensis]